MVTRWGTWKWLRPNTNGLKSREKVHRVTPTAANSGSWRTDRTNEPRPTPSAVPIVATTAATVNPTHPRTLSDLSASPADVLRELGLDLRTARMSLVADPAAVEPDRCRVFAHRHALVDELAALGLEASYLPLAASPRRLPTPAEGSLDRYRCPVSFVGTSLSVDEEALVERLRRAGADAGLLARVSALVTEIFDHHRDDPTFTGGLAPPAWLCAAVPDLDPVELSDRIDGALSHRLVLAEHCLHHRLATLAAAM